MSNARFRCPHCGQMFEGPKNYIGRQTQCSRCGNAFVLSMIADETKAKLPFPLVWLFVVLKRSFDFKGRSRRREFWWGLLFLWLAINIVGVISLSLSDEVNADFIISGVVLMMFLATLSVLVRRLHDTNKSGWWFLLWMLPVLNIAFFVWLITDGDAGPNRFGLDPKGRGTS